MKRCSKCKQEKSVAYFGKNRSRFDGLQCWCKLCRQLSYKVYYDINKEVESRRKKEYYANNKEKVLERGRIYTSNNKDKRSKYMSEYQKHRKKSDIQYKLKCNLRIRINKALQNNQKVGSAVRDLGCSVELLKKYLEFQFQEGMTWKNYGLFGWHIDHIKPLANFDLTDRKQFLEACHYTNLQPLWAKENLLKGSLLKW